MDKSRLLILLKAPESKGVLRFSGASLGLRLDRFKAKFNIAPLFKNDRFDVTAKDASIQVYRLARIVFTKEDAKMISETFEAITDIGKRKEMFAGIWGNIAEIRGLNLTAAGQKLTGVATGKTNKRFGLGDGKDSTIGAIASDFDTSMAAPSLVDIDRAAFR
jgi:hypothetical protein